VSRLSRQCAILNISQPYRPPRPVTGIALLFTVGSSQAAMDCVHCASNSLISPAVFLQARNMLAHQCPTVQGNTWRLAMSTLPVTMAQEARIISLTDAFFAGLHWP
jgi:hypothetical protein